MPKKIVVTGGNGFIASHVIQQLLESPQNYKVTATVRSISAKGSAITAFPGAAERLTLKEADLNNPESFDFLSGHDVVLHLASPFALTVKDNQKDLVDPAVNGTLAVLNAAKKAGSVKTVIVTSSLAAVTEKPHVGRILDETVWNQDSTVDWNPYYYSKVAAERAAWDFMAENKDTVGFKLITILPVFVIGPAHTSSINESVQTVMNIIKGGFPVRVNLWWPYVDVRDVAAAHILAFEKDVESGRYIATGDRTINMSEACDIIKERHPEFSNIPSMTAPNILPWLLSFAQPTGTGSYLRSNLSNESGYEVSNQKIKTALGITFRPVEESIEDTVQDLIKWKHI
ncbi:NAD-dependent epimerase/dehydratase [Obelidium mucronatum]|nr:NAD-dependent epimerase/dehydratase [Obelidium mucronatum]